VRKQLGGWHADMVVINGGVFRRRLHHGGFDSVAPGIKGHQVLEQNEEWSTSPGSGGTLLLGPYP